MRTLSRFFFAVFLTVFLLLLAGAILSFFQSEEVRHVHVAREGSAYNDEQWIVGINNGQLNYAHITLPNVDKTPEVGYRREFHHRRATSANFIGSFTGNRQEFAGIRWVEPTLGATGFVVSIPIWYIVILAGGLSAVWLTKKHQPRTAGIQTVCPQCGQIVKTPGGYCGKCGAFVPSRR